MLQLITMKRFTQAGRVQAEELVKEINQAGGQARIGETWLDCGAGIMWETVLVYSNPIQMWYQALNPVDFKDMNDGQTPRYHADILKEAVR